MVAINFTFTSHFTFTRAYPNVYVNVKSLYLYRLLLEYTFRKYITPSIELAEIGTNRSRVSYDNEYRVKLKNNFAKQATIIILSCNLLVMIKPYM